MITIPATKHCDNIVRGSLNLAIMRQETTTPYHRRAILGNTWSRIATELPARLFTTKVDGPFHPTMTIDELIGRLEEYRDVLGGDAAVRLMTQQNWPFENEITGLASGEEINGCDDAEDENVNDDRVVFIVEGRQLGYGSKRAWGIAT